MIRPVQGEEHRALDAVRRADGHWLRPWEATLGPDTLEDVPTFSQYVRRADIDHREGTGLIFGATVSLDTIAPSDLLLFTSKQS